MLSVGSACTVHSLNARPDLNGRRGIVVTELDAAKGRVGVQMEGEDKPLALKPANLKVGAALVNVGTPAAGCSEEDALVDSAARVSSLSAKEEIESLRSKFTPKQLVQFHAQLPADPSSDTPELASIRTVLMMMSEEEDGPVASAIVGGAEACSRKQVDRAARHLQHMVRTNAAPTVRKAKAALQDADARAQEWARMLQRSGTRLKQIFAELDLLRSGLCDTSGGKALRDAVFQLIAMRNQVREASLEMSGAPSERAQLLCDGSASLISQVQRALELFEVPVALLNRVEADVASKRALSDCMLRTAVELADMGLASTHEAAEATKASALKMLSDALNCSENVELLATPALLRTAQDRHDELKQERDTASILAQREVVARRTLKLHATAVAAQEEAAAREADAVGLTQDAIRRGVNGTPAADAAVEAATHAHAVAHAKAEPLLAEAIAAAEEAVAWDTRAADALLRNATRARDLDELLLRLEECGHAASADVREAALALRDELIKVPHEKRPNAKPGRSSTCSSIEASYAY